MSDRLLLDFDALFIDHRLCGELDAGVDGPAVWDDVRLWGADGPPR